MLVLVEFYCFRVCDFAVFFLLISPSQFNFTVLKLTKSNRIHLKSELVTFFDVCCYVAFSSNIFLFCFVLRTHNLLLFCSIHLFRIHLLCLFHFIHFFLFFAALFSKPCLLAIHCYRSMAFIFCV